MIRITVEMIPAGKEELKRIMAMAVIANDGRTKNRNKADYTIWISKVTQSGRLETTTQTWKQARVLGYLRERFNVWYLICVALTAALGPQVVETFDAGQQEPTALSSPLSRQRQFGEGHGEHADEALSGLRGE